MFIIVKKSLIEYSKKSREYNIGTMFLLLFLIVILLMMVIFLEAEKQKVGVKIENLEKINNRLGDIEAELSQKRIDLSVKLLGSYIDIRVLRERLGSSRIKPPLLMGRKAPLVKNIK
jgi:hypothetical protein